eukprot:6205595-Pleurochrysis_carterae.AAC.7
MHLECLLRTLFEWFGDLSIEKQVAKAEDGLQLFLTDLGDSSKSRERSKDEKRRKTITSRRTERRERGAGGPRDGQSARKGQGRPRGKRDESGQEAETGSGGELTQFTGPGEPRPPQKADGTT